MCLFYIYYKIAYIKYQIAMANMPMTPTRSAFLLYNSY